jgi:FixJ family two-component response regulator
MRCLFVSEDRALLTLAEGLSLPCPLTSFASAQDAVDGLKPEDGCLVADQALRFVNGTELLERSKLKAPLAARVLLVEEADLDIAVDAVNRAEVFRLLVKPCSQRILGRVLTLACDHFLRAERQRRLLREALRSNMEIALELLAVVRPDAVARAVRLRKIARALADGLGLENPWQYELACVLKQVGAVTDNGQRDLVAQRIAGKLPGLAAVAAMLGPRPEDTLGASVVETATRFEALVDAGSDPDAAIAALRDESGDAVRGMLDALAAR